MKRHLTDDDLDQLFRKKPVISTHKVIKLGIKRYGLTYEDSRDMLYRALDDGRVKLTPLWKVERVHGNVHS